MRLHTLYCNALALCAAMVAVTAASAQTMFPRNVLIEEFTSVTCGPCAQATPIINGLVSSHPGRVYSVRYHMSFPAPGDPWYLANPSDNDNRKTYYGILGIPAATVDGGGSKPSPINASDMNSAVTTQLESQTGLKIQVTHKIEDNNTITATTTVTANEDGLLGTYVLRAAVVERRIDAPYVASIPNNNGEREFFDVMRAMVPNASGQGITLNPNQSKEFPLTLPIEGTWNKPQLYIVAWVQDEFAPNDILQVGATAPLVGVRGTASETLAVSLTPNPTCGVANVKCTLATPSIVTVAVYDALGRKCVSDVTRKCDIGEHNFAMELNDLANGMYRADVAIGDKHYSIPVAVAR